MKSCRFLPGAQALSISRVKPWRALSLVVGLVTVCQPDSLNGATPTLLWTNSLSARIFAVDAQTNVYAHAGGAVIVLNGSGVQIASNSVCPLPGVARRDLDGSYFFAGSFDGTQDFGGITLVGGWTNWPGPGRWTPGFPTCFLAKYSSAGALQWVSSSGYQSRVNTTSDLLLAGTNGFFLSYMTGYGDGEVTHFNSAGGNVWNSVVFPGSPGFYELSPKLGGLTSSNFFAVAFRWWDYAEWGRRVDFNGTSQTTDFLDWNDFAFTNGVAIIDDQAHAIQLGTDSSTGDHVLRKGDTPETDIWRKIIPSDLQWVLGRDRQGNIYTAGTNGVLTMFTTDGDLVWTTNLGTPATDMVTDGFGNIFVSFSNGVVGRLGTGPASISGPLRPLGFSTEGFVLAISAPPGSAWTILTSTDFVHWQQIGSVTNTSPEVQFTDTAATGLTSRFYKLSGN